MDTNLTILSAQDDTHLQEIAMRFHQPLETERRTAHALVTSAMDTPEALAGTLRFTVRRTSGRLLRADFVGHAVLPPTPRKKKNAASSYGLTTNNTRRITIGVRDGEAVGLDVIDALAHAYPVPNLVVRLLLCDARLFPPDFLTECVMRLRKFSPLAVLQLSGGGVHAGHFGSGGFQDKHADRLVPYP
jgi:hypothetical protein